MKRSKILIVDDEKHICESLKDILKPDGYKIDLAFSGKEAINKFTRIDFDLVLLDINMPEMNGMEVLSEITNLDSSTAVIMATVKSDINTVVKATKKGANNFIIKPFDDISLIRATVEKELKTKALNDENRYLKNRLNSYSSLKSVIANSPNMQELFRMIRKVAPLNTTILLIGDTGTGKEIVAQAIHQFSSRSDNKFISINCGGIPESLLESTLFGYEKGAFTGAYKRKKGIFEEADNGTLFLDEIGETSPALQIRLLRVLQEKSFNRVGGVKNNKVNVRIISATNKDLQNEVKNGNFREDLYYRLNVITLFIPPLSERSDDIPLLAKHFLKKYATIHNKPAKKIEQEAIDCLIKYNWPGNVRELENVIERSIIFSNTPNITSYYFPDSISKYSVTNKSKNTIYKFKKTSS